MNTATTELSTDSDRYSQIRRVTLVGAVLDLLLAIFKMVFGVLANSQALIADAVHSLSDLATDGLVLFAAKHGSREADEDHPYGHGRIETVATVVLGLSLILVAVGIAWDAVDRLFNPEELLVPGMAALVVAAASVLSKEWIYHYTIRVARRLNSNMLRANAWHSRSDAVSSIVVVVGVAGTMAGLPYLDAIAAVGVALMVAKIGWELGWNSLSELMDTALEAERVEHIRKVILSCSEVRALHFLRTRRMGGDALVDVHVIVDPRISVSEGHQIAERVHRRLVEEIEEVQDVLVHIDPEDDEVRAPNRNLPPRSEVVQALTEAWAGIPGADRAGRITLHYLEGRISVEAVLPLEVVDGREPREYSRELAAAATAALPVVQEVLVSYQ